MTSSSASASLSEDNDSDDAHSPDQDIGHQTRLKIVEHPCKHFRYRYASEMEDTHGFITGRNSQKDSKTFPTVQLCNYSGSATIKCSLAQWNSEEVHVHLLDHYSLNQLDVGPDIGYTVSFQNLCIVQRTLSEVNQLLGNTTNNNLKTNKKKKKKSPIIMELNKIRLKFSAYDSVDTNISLCPPVYSTVIYNLKHASTKKLKICRMSRASGSALGGDEIFMFVEKVKKEEIGVRMVEYKGQKKFSWREDCIFNKHEDVHHQHAIVVKTPPYKDVNIINEVNVFIELYRKKTSERSKRLPFIYSPEFRSDSYTTITDNGPHINLMEPARTKYNVISTPLLSGLTESGTPSNKLPFSEDYREPLQLIDTSEYENQLNTDEVIKFTESFPRMIGNYFQDSDCVGDVMDIDFGPILFADSIKRKSSGISKKTAKEASLKTKTTGGNLSDIFTEDASSEEKATEITTDNTQSIFKPGGFDKSNGTSKTAVKVEIASDIEIEEASFDSFEDSDDFPLVIPSTSNPSTSSHNKAVGIKKVAMSNKKEEPKKNADLDSETLDKNCDSEIREIDARLLDAIAKDDEALLEDLLDEGLSPSVCDNNGNNAVHCAVNSKSCLPVLLKVRQGMISEAINGKNHESKTPLHLAVLQNCPEKVKLLLSHFANHDAVDNDGRTALHLAAQKGYLEVVETLLESVPAIEVDMVDGKGHTALQLVCAGQDTPDNRAIIELLLEKGADVSATIVDDLSAIQLSKEKPKMMRILQTYVFS